MYADDFRFYLNAELDGQPIEINAGENDYFLETNFGFSDSIVEMRGFLNQENNPQRRAFALVLRGGESLASASQFVAENELQAGPVAFRDATLFRAQAGFYNITFQPDSSLVGQNFQWQFEDGSVSTDFNPVKMLNVQDFQTYDATLILDGNCDFEVLHQVNIEKDCDATFGVEILAGNIMKLTPNVRQGSVSATKWFLDGTAINLNANNEFALTPNLDSVKVACEFSFEKGCQKRVEKTFDPLNAACLADFSYQKEKEKTYDPQQLATVVLNYWDENGKEFTSLYNSVEGDFKILSTQPYEMNDAGQMTTRIFFETDITLMSADGQVLELTNCVGSFAVAHP